MLLVYDSIVRGTTSKKIIELVRQAGATQVHFVSTCPPIRHACFYGIDFPSADELIAAGRDAHQIETALGADRVIYLDIEGLRAALRAAAPESGMTLPCMACLDGKYPTDVAAAGGRFAAVRKSDRKGSV